MSAKKKRIIALVALVAVLGAVIGVLVWLKNRPTETEPYVSPYISLVSADSDSITKLSFGKVGGEMYEFTYADYSWQYSGDLSFPVNGTILTEMASTVSSVTALREVANEEKPEYGLGEGALHIVAEYSDKQKADLIVGALNEVNSYTYIKIGDGRIYMFTDSLTESFTKELNDLIQLDDFEATVDTNYLVAVDVSDKDGHTNSITDTAGIRAAFDQSDAYDCVNWIEYAVTPERFAEYGIDSDSARMIIRYKAAHSVTDDNGESTTLRVEEAYEIIFGDRFTEEGEDGESAEFVYYTVTGSTIVYKVSAADFEATMAYLDYVPEDADTEVLSDVPDASTETDGLTETDTEIDSSDAADTETAN